MQGLGISRVWFFLLQYSKSSRWGDLIENTGLLKALPVNALPGPTDTVPPAVITFLCRVARVRIPKLHTHPGDIAGWVATLPIRLVFFLGLQNTLFLSSES